MKKMKLNALRTIAFFLVSFQITGCASFPRNQLPIAAKVQPAAANENKPSVSYSFSSGVDLFGKQDHNEKVRSILERELIDVLNESRCFASMSPNGPGDIYIQVELINSGNPAAMIPAIITGASLYTIPSWATDKYNVTAKIRVPGQKEHTYTFADSMTTAQWLPLVVVAPFKNMVNVSKDVRKNIWQTMILNMQKDAIFKEALAEITRKQTLADNSLKQETQTSSEADTFARLKALKELKDSGVLTDEEYETHRKALFDKL